jgi:hypothetical protein
MNSSGRALFQPLAGKNALVHQVRDWGSGAAIKMGQRLHGFSPVGQPSRLAAVGRSEEVKRGRFTYLRRAVACSCQTFRRDRGDWLPLNIFRP